MTKARRGIYAAAVSPFDSDGALDVARLIAYCQFLLSDGGCDGVAPTGTTGEGCSIAVDQRMPLPGAFSAAGIAPDQVILGTGNPAVDDAVRLTRACMAEGYVNVLVLPPYYYKGVSDEGLFAYFARIVEKVGDDRLRMFLYHFPQVSATPLSPALLVRLREAFGPVIAGVKDSSGDFSQSRAFAEATGGVSADFDVYPSSEAMLFDGLDAGCAGIISGSTNTFAPLVQAALAEGPGGAAFERVKDARGFASGFSLMAAMKYAEFLRTGDAAWLAMAPPLTMLGDDDKARFKEGIAAYRDL